LLIGGILFGAIFLFAQDRPLSINVNSNNIAVEVSVTDSANRFVMNLTKDDFSIYEDGKLQEIQGFYPVETSCSILLLFDRSSSTKNQWPLLQTALDHFVDALRPQDRVSIATFAEKTTLRLDWWNLSKGRPADVLSAAKIENYTEFYSAINWALNRVRRVNTRKGVVVLTDGIDSTKPIHSYNPQLDEDFQKLLRSVRSSRVPLYFVALNTDLNPDGREFNSAGRLRMEQLKDASGGGILFPKNAADISPFFGQIARDVGSQYGLAYQQPVSSRDGKAHTIEVIPRDRKLTVRQSRTQYIVN